MKSTKDSEEKSVLKEDKRKEEFPLTHIDEEKEKQISASPTVSHIETNLMYDNITGKYSDKKWSDFKFLARAGFSPPKKIKPESSPSCCPCSR